MNSRKMTSSFYLGWQSVYIWFKKNLSDIMSMDKSDMLNGLFSVAIISLCPILIYVIFKRTDLLTMSLFGTLFATRTDPGGIYTVRLRTMTIGLLLLLISLLLATIVNNSSALTVVSVLIWTFIGRMLTIFGSRGTRLGSMAVISLIIFLSLSPDMSKVAMYALTILLTAFWTMAIKLSLWLNRKNYTITKAVSEYFFALSSFIPNMQLEENPESHKEDIINKRLNAQRTRNIAYLMIRDLKGRYNETTWKMYLLLKEADSLSAICIALFEYKKEIYFQHIQPALQKTACQVMEIVDDLLIHIADSIQNDKSVRGENILELASKEIESSIKELKEKFLETGDYEAYANATYLYGLIEEFLNAIQRILKIINYSGHKFPAKDEKRKHQSSFEETRRLISENMSLSSPAFRYSLLLSVTISIAASMYVFLDIPHGHWIMLTVAIIMKDNFQDAGKKALQRVGGTIAGGLIALLMAAYIKDLILIVWIMIVFWFLATAMYTRNYSIYAFFWTPIIILLININDIGNFDIAIQRITNTLIGGILAFLAMLIFFPRWEKVGFRNQIKKTLNSNHSLILVIMDMYCGESKLPLEIEKLRQQAVREYINLVVSFRRFSSWSICKQRVNKEISKFIIINQQLCNILTILSLRTLKDNDELPDLKALFQQISELLLEIGNNIFSTPKKEISLDAESNLLKKEAEISSQIIVKIIELTNTTASAHVKSLIKTYISLEFNLKYLSKNVGFLYNASELTLGGQNLTFGN